MIKTIGKILVCLFIGVGIFAFSKALMLFRTNESLIWQINNNYKPRIAQLENLERENKRIDVLLKKAEDDLKGLKEEDRAIKDTLQSKNVHIKQLQDDLDKKDDQIAQIQEQYKDLVKINNLLKEKVSALYLELTKLKEEFSSVEKLKERIRYLRSDLGSDKRYARGGFDPDDPNRKGNGGYLTRNGKSTFIPRVKINVVPIEG